MAKTSGEFEKEFIETAKEKTGRTLEQWLSLLKPTGYTKQMDLLNWLKSKHNLNHMQAQFVAGIYLNNGKPVYQNESGLLDNQFAKSESMRALFEEVAAKIIAAFPGTQMIPKKTYVSFTATREFAAINIKPAEIRLGMDLGDQTFSGVVEKSKLTGPMPRISHMVVINKILDYNKQVDLLLQKSYDRTHKNKKSA